ncbi:LysR family transcriptional regulator [Pseudomonas lijiangensis]|uniref:LysR family transcriptional regulator n=1 Tax=Pseudomonas lijiangensis TaxID=2995658 RepID=A0ABX8HUY7_9PSED|nr:MULTISPECIES: LysR family transcriptional regulator [Pseudomonas syringae group]MBX8490552.1 LysR family transcriptional regulator [Pseudomonas cichorii]MBX8499056.1 LysR family transcriptional regulator [Pseudomonas lijiangensis]MBX8504075.1 LysR family transcriptional regulator [Pseudomonas lijiangensis]MBX8540855.1 LysR family transcriptional regulator [Pseudomonas cichorii]MBX8550803.1 LysR family transcriptional regulator [Pseudomonas cichorii]
MIRDFALRDYFSGLLAFIAVARERSFTRGAAQLGLSQSAVSHAVRGLETSLGVRLLARNTRTVIPTEAGERLLKNVAPQFEEIDAELASLQAQRDTPTGTIRITASDHAIRSVLSAKLKKFLPKYPAIKVEIVSENQIVDIAAQRYDAGVRLGEHLDQDMIAVRISPDIRFAVVATKAYFARHPVPQTPGDLVDQNCINIRLATHGGLWPWEFEREGSQLNVRVDGQLVYNSTHEVLDAVIAGLGLAYIPEDMARPYIRSGHLIQCLEEWCPFWSGFHLYYPSRRQPSGAMSLLIAELRHESSDKL